MPFKLPNTDFVELVLFLKDVMILKGALKYLQKYNTEYKNMR